MATIANQPPETPTVNFVSSITDNTTGDIYPDFSWITVSDSTTPAVDIQYVLAVYSGSDTLMGSATYIPGEPASRLVMESWMSGLTPGSYTAKLKAFDGELFSDETTVEFTIKTHAISPDDVIIKTPTFVDPYLDVVRFWNKTDEAVYNNAKRTDVVILV